jgi:hypothetical protein
MVIVELWVLLAYLWASACRPFVCFVQPNCHRNVWRSPGRVADPFALMSDFHIIYTGIVVIDSIRNIRPAGGTGSLANQRPAACWLIAAFLSV